MSDLFVFAGEASGDLHGEQLIEMLKKQAPQLNIFGVGGPLMRKAGLKPLLPMEKFEVMGFVDVFRALPRLARQFFFLRNAILRENPKVVLLIDYPGFNLALSKSLAKRGYKGKICQYICPSVWAWNKKRIPKMEKNLDHLFTILPFEPKLFNPEKLETHFVGHPLIHRPFTPTPIDVPKGSYPIALFPGSREKELHRNLPIQLEVAKKLLNEFPALHFLISVAKPSFLPCISKMVNKAGLIEAVDFVSSEKKQGLMKKARLAIAKSGTITLELALQKIPTIVTYGISPLDLFIARKILRINLPHYCLVNILAGETVFPELIGPRLTPRRLFMEVRHFLTSPEARRQCREKCEEISIILGRKEPEKEIAKVIKSLC